MIEAYDKKLDVTTGADYDEVSEDEFSTKVSEEDTEVKFASTESTEFREYQLSDEIHVNVYRLYKTQVK